MMTPSEAVLSIWRSRTAARARQLAAGRADAGLRSEVTSGGHMNAMTNLIARVFVDAGLAPECIHSGRSRLELPGHFRAEKQWDIVVIHEGRLIAAIELKAIASSFGNNLNNRAEEALGNAIDLAHSIKGGLVGPHAPWLGYVFVIRDEAKSNRPVKVKEPHFAIDPTFRERSYVERAQILCSRLVLERLYNKSWFVTANPDRGVVSEPDPEMTWAKFEAAIRGVVAEAKA